MKKFGLFLVLLTLIVGSAFAQQNKKHMAWVLPTRSTAFGDFVKAGDLVFITADSTMYVAATNMGPMATGSYLVANSSRYHGVKMSTTLNGYDASYFVDTATAQNVYGVKKFYSPIEFGIGTQNIAMGHYALHSNTTGTNSIALGHYACAGTTTNGDNIGIGYSAVKTATTSYGNIGIGKEALTLTTGGLNTAVGYASLVSNTTGIYNTAFGAYTIGTATASNNSGFGAYALGYTTTGAGNTAIGTQSGELNVSGSNNIFIGLGSGPIAKSVGTLSNRLYINNAPGGSDTAIIYGTMSSAPKTSRLEINAVLRVVRIADADTVGLGIPANRGIVVYLTGAAKHYGYNGSWHSMW